MSSRVTDPQVQQAKKERDYYEVKVEAAELKKDLHRLLKGVGEDPGGDGAPRPIDRVREAAISGLEIRAFQDALGGNNSPESNPRNSEPSQKAVQEANDARTRIIESLAKAGKSPEEIEKYVSRLGPLLDMASIAKDPTAQLLLYSRFGQNPGEMQFKDVVETIKLVNDMKGGSNNQSGVAEIANALVEAFKAGKETTQAANPGMGGFEAYKAGMEFITPILDKQSESVKVAFQERIKTLEERIAQSNPVQYLKELKETTEALGIGGVDKEIELHKLHMEEKQGDRQFEREMEDSKAARQEKAEIRKDNRQQKMLERVFKGVEVALESPVIKEAGKMVGSKLEGKVPDVRGQAARSQLTEPMQDVREFKCPKCQRTTQFTNTDLVGIANRGGRWVCPTQGCGAAYVLPKEGAAQK